MKCIICNNITTWDESFGPENFIVCPKCHHEFGIRLKKVPELTEVQSTIVRIIMYNAIGVMKERNEK